MMDLDDRNGEHLPGLCLLIASYMTVNFGCPAIIFNWKDIIVAFYTISLSYIYK